MKILLVEDDPSTRELLAHHLHHAHYVVEQAADGATALELALLWNYDLVVLDVNLPKLDGMSLCRQLRAQGLTTPILMLTAQSSDTDVVQGLDAGADDYVTKPFEVQRVMARVRALLRRGTTTPAIPPLQWGALCLNPSLAQVTYRNVVVPLTPKEYGLLELFLRYPQRVFSRSAILDELWTIDDSPTEGAVTNLVKDLRNRLKRHGMEENPIQTVYGLGYRLRDLPLSAAATVKAASQSAQPTPPPPLTRAAVQGLEMITARFQASIRQRVAVLEEAIRCLQAGGLEPQQRQMACEEAHRLAGGLGTFGYNEGSTLAHQIETLLCRENALGQAEVDQISSQVLALKQILTRPPASAPSAPPPAPRCRIRVVNLMASLAAALDQAADQRGWHLEQVPTLTLGPQTPTVADVDGVILSLDPTLPAAQKLAPLRDLKHRYPQLPVLVLTPQDSLEERVQVARLRGDRYLTLPVTAAQILDACEQILPKSPGEVARVMVVDPDPVDRATICELLTPWGLQVIELADPQQFWHLLRETQPDLLVLAMDLPTFSGTELCQVVRQDPQYGNLPILMITPHPDTITIRQVFEVGGDDLVGKPIVGPELVTRVLSRLERSRLRRQIEQMRQQQVAYWGYQDKIDALTQVANSRHFDAFLQQQWERHRQDRSPLSLILCTPDHFQAYQQLYGIQASNFLLRRLAQTLNHGINPNIDLVARTGALEFGVVLPNTTLDGALRVVGRLQNAVAELRIPHGEAHHGGYITLSVGLSGAVPRDTLAREQLLNHTYQALQEAKARGGNTFNLYPLS
ncbi:MAG TPA: response regulator [Leptolyngbyaceae cyanobacterium M65_K2018_010]|nr:response regulator [Leptolyngbyaceae cyanobacterium M65_K2018_010]